MPTSLDSEAVQIFEQPEIEMVVPEAFDEEGNMKKKSIYTKGIELKLDILQRHLQLLNTLQKNEPAGIVKLSKLGFVDEKSLLYTQSTILNQSRSE